MVLTWGWTVWLMLLVQTVAVVWIVWRMEQFIYAAQRWGF